MKSLLDQTRIHNPINTVKENIIRENQKLHLNKYLFSSDIQDYAYRLLKIINPTNQTNYSRKLSQFLVKYYLFCLSRQNDKSLIPSFRKKLGTIISGDYELSSWFLRNAANESFLKEIFLECLIDDVKYLISGLFIEAIKTVCAQEDTLSYEKFIQISSILPILNIGIYLVISTSGVEAKQLDLFHRILCTAGELSVNARRYLLKQKMVGRIQSILIEIRCTGTGYQDFSAYRTQVGISEFEVENSSVKEEQIAPQKIQSIDELLEQKEINRRIMSIKKNLQYLVKLHSILVRSVQPFSGVVIPEPATFQIQPRIQHQLDKDELETFKFSGYIKRLIPLCFKKAARNYLTLTQAYLTTENEPLLNDYLNNWGAVISDTKIDEDDLKPYFIFLKNILLIEDSLKLKRVKAVVQKCAVFMQNNFRHFYAGQIGINAIIKFGAISKMFASEIQKEIQSNKDFLTSLENFLQSNTNLSLFLNNRQVSLFRDINRMQSVNNQYLQSIATLIRRSGSSRREIISALCKDGQLPPLEYDSDEDYSEHITQLNEKVDLLIDGEYQTYIVTESLGDLVQLQKYDDKDSSRWVKFDDEILFPYGKAAKYNYNKFEALHY